MTKTDMTVRDLITRLACLDLDAPVRLAINPHFPMAHSLADVLESVDPAGRTTVYIAEAAEGIQHGYLPRPVAEALTWMPPVGPPARQHRRSRAVSP